MAWATRRTISTADAAANAEVGEDFVSLGLERVAGEDGGGFSEDDVAGGLAAAEVVVVERGQVVVDERIGVQHLDRCAEFFDSVGWLWGARNHAGGFDTEHWAQALAAGEDAVAHGLVDRGRGLIFCGDEAFEGAFGALRSAAQRFFHIYEHFNHIK